MLWFAQLSNHGIAFCVSFFFGFFHLDNRKEGGVAMGTACGYARKTCCVISCLLPRGAGLLYFLLVAASLLISLHPTCIAAVRAEACCSCSADGNRPSIFCTNNPYDYDWCVAWCQPLQVVDWYESGLCMGPPVECEDQTTGEPLNPGLLLPLLLSD